MNARGRRELTSLVVSRLELRKSSRLPDCKERRLNDALVLILTVSNMKKVFTAEQISDWFTSGTTFASIKLTEEAAERKLEEPASNEATR